LDDPAKTNLVGRTLAHYRINHAIGAGGMGEVYRATDTKLGRDVALKVLPSDMASDPDRLARFQREARAVAALNHPNVVTIYSVEESENVHFITMELIEGQPLDRLISANGLGADRIIEIAGAIAEALAAAHEKAIVHRDLKPANVMVTSEGRVKVLDFGLAKDVGAESASDANATLTSAGRTQAGMVMGTPAYMSPEQVSGRPLDHRSDIFSFGVLLHEMATGRRPFEGGSSAELISSILRDTPPSVSDARPELPSDLARVIRRCLEKDPRYRVQTARDVSNEFRDLARTAARLTPVSTSTPRTPTTRAAVAADSGVARADEGFWVAVLPFKFVGGNADLVALAEGLTDDIVTGMAKFSYLRVIARSSTAQYAQRTVDVRTAAKELGARYVMEGSLRQAGSKLRLTVQLVEATTGSHLWAETYERGFNPDAVFELQDELVPRIVSTVADRHGVLPHSMSEAVRAKDPEQLTPYEAVLLSFSYAERITSDEQIAAKACLERAVAQVPGYADAWAMLAMTLCDEFGLGFKLDFSLLERGLEAARRAVKVGPSNHLGYQNLAYAHFLRREFGPCKSAVERSLALNSMDGCNVWFMGLVLAYMGDWERGCALVERAMQLNPNFPEKFHFPLVANAYRKGDYGGALNEALRMNLPDVFYSPLNVAAAAGQLGERETAEKALRDVLRLKPDIAKVVRRDLGKWFQPELVEHYIEGLMKAGLEIPAVGGVSAITSSAIPAARTTSGAARADEGFWVAVLPFKYTGSNADLKALAEGLSEEVITGLSRFSYLRVIARGSTAKYSSESGDVRAIGKELGARYVMEGSLRQAGTKLRLAVQLVDTISGAHLWAENYERGFSPETVFEIQDDLVPRIVSTVADAYGVLPYSMSDVVRNKPLEQLTPYESILRAIGYGYRLTPEEHAVARTCMEQAVQQAPGYADGWAMLSLLCSDEFGFEFPGPADPLGRALQAARRATEAAPSSSLAQTALAKARFFRKEFQAFRSAAEQAIALNPMDGAKLANLGCLLAYSGDWDHGCALLERAMQLNPRHPGWYWFPLVNNAYRKGDYRGALNLALKINLPGFFPTYEVLAAIYGQLGEREAASQALGEMLKLVPNFGKVARGLKSKWFQPEMVEHVLDGLRKAGLEIPDTEPQPSTSGAQPARTTSGAARANEGFWVAVLPFKYLGNSGDLKALTEGLSEELTTGLSRFSYLRVIARASTAKYSSESGDVRAIGKELGARYVMEGSLRQASSKLRVAVQLADTVSGAHLWAETYERAFTVESVFEVQDDLVPRIVSTVADQYGVLPRSMSDVLRGKRADALTAHEAVLRAFSYFSHIAPEEHAVVRDILERSVRQTPDHADSWAMLSMIYRGEFAQGYNPRPNPLARALAAAQRAVELAPTHALGHYALATVYFFRKEKIPFRVEAERALALNPLDASVKAYLGLLIASTGEWDRGCQMVESALQLNPNCPGYFYFARCWNAYWQGKYAEVLEGVALINMPNYFHVPAIQAAALGQLGRQEEAQKVLRDVLALRPDFAVTVRQEYAKWFDAELIEPVLDGLRKAGLEIPEKEG
jgi:TolB-like protein/Tfp pilus assembly protein PilF